MKDNCSLVLRPLARAGRPATLMRFYCTLLDIHHLTRGLALQQSLAAHAGDFQLVVLCLDEATETALRQRTLPNVRLLKVSELVAQHPSLAAARNDRTMGEFALTCKSWLLHHLLPQMPTGALLTFVDSSLYFFGSPQPLFDEIGSGSVAIIPRRLPASLSHLERHGKFSVGWVSLRHDATGLACAADWAEQCAAWCFAFPEADRFAEQRYLDAWPLKYPGTVSLTHPGTHVAPWNLPGTAVTNGPAINGQLIIFFDFRDLVHLDRQLYDPGLHRYGIKLTAGVREHIYRPYLRLLGGPDEGEPDIVPPADSGDPRCGAVLSDLLENLRLVEQDRAATKVALDQSRADALRALEETRAREAAATRYMHQVEQDRNEQRQAYFDTKKRLEEVHQDLLHNIAYLKKLEAEAAAHRQASIDREAYVSSLKEQLAQQQTGGGGPDLAQLHLALVPRGRDLRRMLVARYHPALLPTILSLSSLGVGIEVLASPPEFAGETRGSVHFLGSSLWEWLGGLNSLFDEKAYLRINPDIAAAVADGTMLSGWDHYLRFGQHEGRRTGTPDFRTGLADFDAVAFDSADADLIVPCLIGRLQPHQRLFVSSSYNPATVWLPIDTNRTIVLGDLLCCNQPPREWRGPRLPSALPVPHRAKLAPEELYPAAPDQPAVWPKISVVTVCRNQASDLADTLRSVLDQQYPNLEYLVVDEASTDGSVAIIERHAGRLAWWTSVPVSGTPEALNMGLAKSTGTILTWVAGGDQLAPGSLFTVAQQFLLHDPDLLAGRCAQIADQATGANHLHRSVLALGRIQPLPLPELLDLDRCWLAGWFFQQPEVFFSRRILGQVGGRLREDLQHGFDYDLWVRMARVGARILPLPEILAIHRASPGDASGAGLAELTMINTAHRAQACPAGIQP